MQEITSINNDLVKQTVKFQQKKYRDKDGKFLLEGSKCVKEAFDANLVFDYAFVLKEKAGSFKYLGNKLILTNEAVLKKISTTDTPPDIVAVAYKKIYNLSDLKNAKKVVLLENIKDLGNLGTILRTSIAFSADGVVLYGKECADVYNPKCVRASVGNLWKIPVLYIEQYEILKKFFSSYERVATLPRTNTFLKNLEVDTPMLVMFGAEADGLSKELIDFATKKVKIEMADSVESLNLSVSSAVVLYKLFL